MHYLYTLYWCVLYVLYVLRVFHAQAFEMPGLSGCATYHAVRGCISQDSLLYVLHAPYALYKLYELYVLYALNALVLLCALYVHGRCPGCQFVPFGRHSLAVWTMPSRHNKVCSNESTVALLQAPRPDFTQRHR